MESVLTATQDLLMAKIRTRTAKVGVIGLGYVGCCGGNCPNNCAVPTGCFRAPPALGAFQR
jgi:hypothetical protein